MGVFPKIVGLVPPNHPLKNRVFHYFHHPFWGYPDGFSAEAVAFCHGPVFFPSSENQAKSVAFTALKRVMSTVKIETVRVIH